MGRAPCCDKANVKRGPWSPEEDSKLKSYIEQHGTGGNWIALPQKIGLKRCGKSCRLRWLNYLRPNIKHGGFSEEEDTLICNLYISIGSRWSIIAAQLPGRTDNDIKNYWNTRLKKKLLGKQRKEQQAALKKSRNNNNNNNIVNTFSTMHSSDHQYRYQNEIITQNINPNYYPNQSYLPLNDATTYYPVTNNESTYVQNDHASIRKFLIKLGGRFSEQLDDDQMVLNTLRLPVDQNQEIVNGPAPVVPFRNHSSSSNSSAKCVNDIKFTSTTTTTTTTTTQFMQDYYNVDPSFDVSKTVETMFPINEAYTVDPAGPQRLDANNGMEFLYADGMIDNRLFETSDIGRGEISNDCWGDMMIEILPFGADYEVATSSSRELGFRYSETL